MQIEKIGTDLSSARVLIVDDEVDARNLVARILGDHGADVSVAGSADEALTFLENGPFNLFISDIGMPGTDGYTLIRRIREQYPSSRRSMPAIAITAFARSEDRTRALLSGFQSHIAKPLEPAELVATVSALLSSIDPVAETSK
jgi:CheY-like chemotaxis protein